MIKNAIINYQEETPSCLLVASFQNSLPSLTAISYFRATVNRVSSTSFVHLADEKLIHLKKNSEHWQHLRGSLVMIRAA